MTRYETILLLLSASLLWPLASLATESDSEEATPGATSAAPSSSAIPVIPSVGMTMKAARDLLQFETTNERLIGGGCGMLQILTNEDESIRVIGVGGVVTSVNNSNHQKRQGQE